VLHVPLFEPLQAKHPDLRVAGEPLGPRTATALHLHSGGLALRLEGDAGPDRVRRLAQPWGRGEHGIQEDAISLDGAHQIGQRLGI